MSRFARSTPIALLLSAVLVVLTIVNVGTLGRTRRAQRLAGHGVAARSELRRFRDTMLDSETGQRGYLLTGDPKYLEPFERGSTDAFQTLDRLAVILPDRAADLADLRRLCELKIAELRATIALERTGRHAEALVVVNADAGRVLMDRIRAHIAALIDAQDERVAADQTAAQVAETASLVADGAAAVAIGILTALLFRIDRDIRRREELERDLRRQTTELSVSRSRFETTLSSIGDAVIATDATGAVSFMNDVAERLTGWGGAEAAGKPLDEIFVIVHEESRAPVENPVTHVLRQGTVVGLANHTVLIARGGGERPIDDSAAPIRGPDGQLAGVVLVFRDVTERRRAEARQTFLSRATAALAASLDTEHTLATVARLAVPAIADCCLIDVGDEETTRRLGVADVDPARLDRLPGIQIDDVGLVAPIDDERLRALGFRSLIGVPMRGGDAVLGGVWLATAGVFGPDDLALARRLADKTGVAVQNARLLRDLRRARSEADARRVEADLANRSKDEFLAILGHELRNPLAPIMTALELMRLRAGAALERERTIIERQMTHMVRMVDDLLDVSRITRGKIELASRPVAVAEVLAKGLEMASPLIEQRQHAVSVAAPPELFVEGDPARLAQVVSNLLNNAAKYTEKGGRITVAAERDGGDAVIRVRDSGIGIAPEMLPRIFDLFVQEQQATDRAQGGLGLGLAIVRSLVALHGGSVRARSDGLGKGAELEVRLPARARQADASAPPDAPAPRAHNPNATRVLVVDDNADACTLLAEALQLLGHEAACAGDGPAAIRMAARVRPRIALLDIGLPVMDGYELARRLRELDGAIGLVAVTGYGQESDRKRSLAVGFDAHLVKPVSLAAIEETLERLLRSA